MSSSIEQAVMQIKHDVSKAFDAAAIVAMCQSIGYSWRTRQFDPVTTIQGFLLQVLHGNTACSHVPRLLGKDVTAEAYGMARSRLPLELFQQRERPPQPLLTALIASRVDTFQPVFKEATHGSTSRPAEVRGMAATTEAA